MAPLVIPHVALRSEAFVTMRASERSFVVMNPLMDSQILLFGEAFATGREHTAERLRPIVDVLMCLQSNVSLEAFTTAFVRANEHLLFVSRLSLAVLVLPKLGN